MHDGDWTGHYHLGMYYKEVQDKKMDKAIYWLRKAVEKGCPLAALSLAEIYFPMATRHLAIQPDIITSYAWRILAQRGLEDMTATGDIVKNELKTNREQLVMMQFFLMPSEKKQALALVAAWPSQLPPPGNTAPFREKTASRQAQAMSAEAADALYQSAMSKGKAEIDAFISAFFSGKLNVDEKEQLLPVLIKGNALGVDKATNLLAWANIKGRIVEKNEEKGYRMLQAQAKKGNPNACYLLGILEQETRGDSDAQRKKALFWFEKGAARGDTASMNMLAQYYSENKDRKKAAAWYEKAAKAGNENALMALLGMAESDRDIAALGKWMGVIILRASDPMVTFRTRGMLMLIANSRSWDDYQKILMAAEKWHQASPLPKKKTDPAPDES